MDTQEMLIFYSFNLGIFTILFFIAGLINPKWPLFFMENPSRSVIVVVTTVMIMVVATMYGEGNRQLKIKEASAKKSEIATMTPETDTQEVPSTEKKTVKAKKPARPEDDLPQFESTQDAVRALQQQ